MVSPLLLNGNVEDSNTTVRVIEDLRTELKRAKQEAQEWRDKYEESYGQTMAIRRVLQPQFEALQKLFGMLPEGQSNFGQQPHAPQFDQKWEAWKQKLGPGTAPARVIDALLTHGPLNRSQLRQAGELGWSTLDAATSRLKNLSLIEKSGDRWNLKS